MTIFKNKIEDHYAPDGFKPPSSIKPAKGLTLARRLRKERKYYMNGPSLFVPYLISFLVVVMFACMIISATCVSFSFRSSTGSMTGELVKFSERGAFWGGWKTYEGQVFKSDMVEWEFSIRDDMRNVDSNSLAEQCKKLIGEEVRVDYVQVPWVGAWNAKTTYCVTNITVVGD